MSKISSETSEQRVARADAALVSARTASKSTKSPVPAHIREEASAAHLAHRQEQMGPERWASAQAWGKAQIEDRAKRLVSFGHEDKTGHGPMAVVSHSQFAELQSTGTIEGGPVHEPAPKWEG